MDLSQRFNYFIDSITAFSYLPLRLASVLGVVISPGGFLYIAYIFTMYSKMNPPPGRAALMVIVLFVSRIQLIILGVIGEYLWGNFEESRKRPTYVIDETLRIDEPK